MFKFSLAVKSQSYPFKHLFTASSFLVEILISLKSFDPINTIGKINLLDLLFLFSKSTDKTCGITSPALCKRTLSPILISLRIISSSL